MSGADTARVLHVTSTVILITMNVAICNKLQRVIDMQDKKSRRQYRTLRDSSIDLVRLRYTDID